MDMGTSTKVTYIIYPDTHGRWERESLWGIDRKAHRERQVETFREIEREKVGMGERQRKRGGEERLLYNQPSR